MTDRSIEHRTNPVVLSDAELLPSQRDLLDIPLFDEDRPYLSRRLSQRAINTLGEVLAYEVALLIDETQVEAGGPIAAVRPQQNELGLLAGKLLTYDPKADPYEGYDRSQVVITDRLTVDVDVRSGYDIYDGDGTPGFKGRRRFYTPEGFVDDPIGDFRQRLVSIRMKNVHTFAEDVAVNFSSEGNLSVYTNNLTSQPPRWEYSDQRLTDMQPSSPSNPYFFRLRPPLITSEELAQSVVGSLIRVIERTEN